MDPGPTILHADLDAFYASVEQMLHPELRGLPIAVGGGVVLACSYEAKRFGVSSGMSGREALQKCPRLRFVDGHFTEYQRLGDAAMAVLEDFTPMVQRLSIDEAFADVTGSVHLFGPPDVIAQRIRARVRDELGLPISVGAARTKHLAKIASQVAKPDGLVVVPPDFEREFLEPLPVGLMWGIGPVTQQKLADRGIRTIGQLAEATPDALRALLGKALGDKVSALAHNDDRRRVRPNGRAGSVGAQSAFGRCDPDPQFVRDVLSHLADRIAGRLRAKHRAGRTVTVRIRFAGMQSITRSHTMTRPNNSTLTLTETAERLVWGALAERRDEQVQLSLLAISVSNLVDRMAMQLELPFGSSADDPDLDLSGDVDGSRFVLDHSIDEVRRKFGKAAVAFGSVALGVHSSVPDDFRELAEREL
ncbi:MAG: DNA polymerase IV [Ilumatobacteraceae bacterium]